MPKRTDLESILLIGSALQLLVQVPGVLRLLGSLRPTLAIDPGVRQTLSAFGPVLIGRGSVQLSAYLDQVLSSFLGARLVSAIARRRRALPAHLHGPVAAQARRRSDPAALFDDRAGHRLSTGTAVILRGQPRRE